MTNKELLDDLLIEFDELDMQPMLLVPNPLERAKSWKNELEYSIKHLEAEIALSVIENLETEGLLNMTPQGIENLKKKYVEGEG
jgi:hypothetical protein